jgi:curved DNA-binding protein CbpA
MGAYFLDLESLLSRIEFASTHYQALEVERTATQEEIKSSFDRLVKIFYPPYVVSKNMPGGLSSRIDRAFNKASQAFAVLASFERRREYDEVLLTRLKQASPAPTNSQVAGSRPVKSLSGDHSTSLAAPPQPREVHSESSRASSSSNRRRCSRLELTMPVRVTGHDQKSGKWHEMTETLDVSRTGARLRLRRRVKQGTVLYLTLPLPPKLRSHGFSDPSYKIYALVRRVEPPKRGIRAIGVEFLGEHPPAGYLDSPWAIFRPRSWAGADRRRQPRQPRSESIRVEYFDDSMMSLGREDALTENISKDGLRIAVAAAPSEFDLIMLSSPRLKIDGLAAVRNRYRGTDGRERLCLQLIDKE